MITEQHNFDLSTFNTFGIKAVAERFISFDDPEHDLPELFKMNLFRNDYIVLGGGSNMLFCKDIITTPIVHLSRPENPVIEKTISNDGTVQEITVNAAMPLYELVAATAENNWWGMENLAAIPGSVGGATVQNAGAYGVEMTDVITRVIAFDTVSGLFIELNNSDCNYGYRHSIFKEDEGRKLIVTHVTVHLSALPLPRLTYKALSERVTENASASDIMTTIDRIRSERLPDINEVGSAGSFFRNPVVEESTIDHIVAISGEMPPSHIQTDGRVKVPAAWLIERAGYKGIRRNNCGTWSRQPLVIVNYGNATGEEIVKLEKEIISAVRDRFGVTLQAEVEHV